MRIMITGRGRMGMMTARLAEEQGFQVVFMEDGDQQGEPADVIIDFTSPQALNKIIAAAEANGTPLVTGTTGFSSEDTARLRSLSAEVPVLASANFSFGIALMRRMLDDCGRLLIDNGFDCEIEEIHHRNKADAPSGTAKLLFDTLNANGTLTPVYGRCGTEARRSSGEVGIHALRGGTVAGRHRVSFFGEDEIVEISHEAGSRRIFAAGALMAAERLALMPAGWYTFDEILFGGAR